ncbi:MAG: ribbon-helix-helix protein, CopG family [Parasporobacterium sp.]|nr:ribbon-helix-helix protein, CopG family [Parasporobacterium sp.]
MSISLRLNEQDAALIKMYASMHNISVSELIRQAVMEKIEDEYDLAAYERAMAEYKKDSTTYSLEEVEKELGMG